MTSLPLTSSKLVKLRRPTYHLFMPNVQLGFLSQYWGDLEVEEATGRGAFAAAAPTTQSLPYGRLSVVTQGTAYLSYKWDRGQRPSIADIYNEFISNGVPDISLDTLTYARKAKVQGRDTLLLLKFGKDTVHPEVYGKLVVDGAIPKEDLYETIKRVKTQVAQAGFPQETVKRIRYSGLVLYEITPYKDLIYDANAIYSLKESDMLFMKELYKKWELYDYEFRAAP